MSQAPAKIREKVHTLLCALSLSSLFGYSRFENGVCEREKERENEGERKGEAGREGWREVGERERKREREREREGGGGEGGGRERERAKNVKWHT